MRRSARTWFGLLLLLLLPASSAAADERATFRIHVVDDATGRGVPLVQLQTVNQVTYVTDSAGMIAVDEPGLLGQRVFFHVCSHGYEYPADGFGIRGVRLDLRPGGSAEVKLHRINLAERLYRVTGGGIYRDSVLLGDHPPLEQPLLNGQVLGSDSVQNVVFRDKIYWFWGDTNRPQYPLGNFHTPGAVSALPEKGGLPADVGVNLHYFVAPDGFAQETCRMPGDGPTWIDALVVLPGTDGRQRLMAQYAKIKPPLSVYERGLVEFNVEREVFEHVVTFAEDAMMYPGGHPLTHRDGDVDYVYFSLPLPKVRVAATADAMADLSQYEAYTCFTPGSRTDKYEMQRDAAGRLQFAWRKGTLPLTRELQQRLVAQGKMTVDEGLFHMRDAESGKTVKLHNSSIAWNPYRQRWTMIVTELGGTSMLGEIWYSEAPDLLGPWRRARKVVTHEDYSFYNPRQHPMLAQENGRWLYFEGTYTATFSGAHQPTPRYDYNQIMYRLDLADPRLHLDDASQ